MAASVENYSERHNSFFANHFPPNMPDQHGTTTIRPNLLKNSRAPPDKTGGFIYGQHSAITASAARLVPEWHCICSDTFPNRSRISVSESSA